MAGSDPLATAQSLTAALPDSFAEILEPMVSRNFPPEGESTRRFLGWRLLGPVSDQDRSTVLALVQSTLSPMPRRELTALLGELRVTTRSKAESAVITELQLEVYARKLSQWPADVVRALLTQWAEGNDFWPTWHECLEFMESKTRKRRALLEVLSGKGGEDGES